MIAALTLAAVALGSGTASAAPAGCGGKPGAPDRGALLQYCPQDSRSIASGGGGAVAPPTAAPPASSARADEAKPPRADRPKVPVLGYPSSDGVNFLLVALLLLALSVAVAYGARRWRRSRPQPS